MTEQKLNIGDQAPDFTLPDENGNDVTLSDFRGKKVVLYFYPKDDTPGCTAQACGFRDEFPRISAEGATVLGISLDDAESHQRFKDKHDLPFTLLSDKDHAVCDAYRVWGEVKFGDNKFIHVIRSHFLIDEEGRIEDAQINVNPTDSVNLALGKLA